jgi:hypothetical protein
VHVEQFGSAQTIEKEKTIVLASITPAMLRRILNRFIGNPIQNHTSSPQILSEKTDKAELVPALHPAFPNSGTILLCLIHFICQLSTSPWDVSIIHQS